MALSLSYAHGITVIPFNGLHYPPAPNPPKTARWKHTEEWEWGDSALKPWRKKEQRGNNKHGRQKWQWLKPMKWLRRSWLPPPTSQSQVCFDWNGNPAGVARQHTYTHDLSFRISDNRLKTSRFVFEQERWNVIKTKNSEVVLINLFYNKVYKTLFFYKTLGFVSDCLSCVTTVFMSVQLKFCTSFNLLKRSDFDVTGVKIGQRCECSESASGDLCLYNLASIFT